MMIQSQSPVLKRKNQTKAVLRSQTFAIPYHKIGQSNAHLTKAYHQESVYKASGLKY